MEHGDWQLLKVIPGNDVVSIWDRRKKVVDRIYKLMEENSEKD